VNDNNPLTYQHATHYSYDIHGNVNTLIQDNPTTAVSNQQYKQINYSYDLISGNVKMLSYQPGQADRYYHRYQYDSDNRITQVYTSKDSVLWDNDAKYFYFAHGPLARAEVGDNQVQGIDYAYTLQGWIKGVNSNVLKETNDIGQDGLTASINKNFARDGFGYSLGYFQGDYDAIDGVRWNNASTRFEAFNTNSDMINARKDLFNGNISSMVTTIYKPVTYTASAGTPVVLPQGTAYKYDQLNRIVDAKAYQNINLSTNTWGSGSTYNGLHQNTFTYDANGNILSQLRKDSASNTLENLTYRYVKDGSGRTIQNRLYHVNDVAASSYSETDIDDQGTYAPALQTINTANNYGYDEIGNLQRDNQEGIASIEWTVYGKIKSITRAFGFTKVVNGQTIYPSDLEFSYDAAGNRISKIEKPRNSTGQGRVGEWITTYYIRDAQGNILSIYKKLNDIQAQASSFMLSERTIYGSSSLGVDYTSLEMIGATPVANLDTAHRYLGYKHYSGSNHLGNVLAVFSDKKIPRDNTSDGIIDYFQPEILSAMDYSPFGVALSGRSFSAADYRYGFNGKEKDDEVKGNGNSYDFGARIYDSRLGRWFTIDPLTSKYPFNSGYSFASNTPIISIDQEGKYPEWTHYQMTYEALLKAKVDKVTASEIAHYASTYADHPTPGILRINKVLAVNYLYNPGRISYDTEKFGSYEKTANSQSDHLITSVASHGMRTWWETITPEEAVSRALYGGTFTEKDGTVVTIPGAYNVIKSFKGKDISKLSMEEKKELGVALHTIQDVQIHKGKRWVDTHKAEAEKMGHKDEHPTSSEVLGINDNGEKAKALTKEAVNILVSETVVSENK
jgi:RHS repeat-associated protein